MPLAPFYYGGTAYSYAVPYPVGMTSTNAFASPPPFSLQAEEFSTPPELHNYDQAGVPRDSGFVLRVDHQNTAHCPQPIARPSTPNWARAAEDVARPTTRDQLPFSAPAMRCAARTLQLLPPPPGVSSSLLSYEVYAPEQDIFAAVLYGFPLTSGTVEDGVRWAKEKAEAAGFTGNPPLLLAGELAKPRRPLGYLLLGFKTKEDVSVSRPRFRAFF